MTREYNQRSQQNQLLSLCKKDDLNNPDSCSGISLVTIVSKVLASIIRERLAVGSRQAIVRGSTSWCCFLLALVMSGYFTKLVMTNCF